MKSNATRIHRTRLRLSIVALALGALPSLAAAESARYKVTFDATWSAATHPTDFHAVPHFSSLGLGALVVLVCFAVGSGAVSPKRARG